MIFLVLYVLKIVLIRYFYVRIEKSFNSVFIMYVLKKVLIQYFFMCVLKMSYFRIFVVHTVKKAS